MAPAQYHSRLVRYGALLVAGMIFVTMFPQRSGADRIQINYLHEVENAFYKSRCDRFLGDLPKLTTCVMKIGIKIKNPEICSMYLSGDDSEGFLQQCSNGIRDAYPISTFMQHAQLLCSWISDSQLVGECYQRYLQWEQEAPDPRGPGSKKLDPRSEAKVSRFLRRRDCPLRLESAEFARCGYLKYMKLEQKKTNHAGQQRALKAGQSAQPGSATERALQRQRDVTTLVNASWQYAIDHDGQLPKDIPFGMPEEICRSEATDCSGLVDLRDLAPNYFYKVPTDPEGASENGAGYTIMINAAGRVTATAPHAEEEISVTR